MPEPNPATPGSPTPPLERKNVARATVIGVVVAFVIVVGAIGYVALSDDSHSSENPDPTSVATDSYSPSPTPEASPSATEYPADPETGAVPTVFERTQPLPESMALIPDMLEAEFTDLPKDQQLAYYSWLSQYRDDFFARFELVDQFAHPSEVAPDSSAVDILDRLATDRGILVAFADWTTRNPPQINLDEADKGLLALTQGSGENDPFYRINYDRLHSSPRSVDVDAQALGSAVTPVGTGLEDISRSPTTYDEAKQPVVQLQYTTTETGRTILLTVTFVTYEDFAGNQRIDLVTSSTYK